MINFFLSLKTTVWTLFVLVCLFFIGSYMMPVHRDVFGPMNEDILFRWVQEIAAPNFRYTWWLFAAVTGLVLLTVNTIACGIQAVKGRWMRDDFIFRISPQVVHIGFLFILFAHLLGAAWGYKLSGMMPEGAFVRFPENRGLYLRQIRAEADESGHLKDWSAQVTLYENGRAVKSGVLGPNRPLFYGGTGIYLKNLSFERGPAAVLLVAKDPGAVWALAGAILFMLGSVMQLVLKWQKS